MLLLQSMSGIDIDPDVATLFNDMKLRAIHKWATFKIKNKKEVVIDQTGEPDKTDDRDNDKKCFHEMVKSLTDEPRFILYDFGFTNKEGRVIKKLAFLFW